MAKLRAATGCSHSEIRRFLNGELGFLTAGKARRMEQLFATHVRRWVRGSPRYAVQVGQVPTSLVAPLIADSYSRRGRSETARLVGTTPRQLFGITEQRRAVSFDIADLIAVRLAGPDWWYEDEERRRWLWSHRAVLGRFRAAEAARPRVEARTSSGRPRGETSAEGQPAGRRRLAHTC
jgi:hypothetical protein